MATADAFRGLAEIDYSVYAAEVPTDKFQGAFPTFRTFVPAGGAQRDEVVILRASVARKHARSFVTLGGMVDEANIPSVFRTINPAGDPTTCGFPTFTYGRNSSGQFMNVIELKAGFRRVTAPVGTAGLTDLTMVETACAAAQAFAVANGFVAGFPTFNIVAGGAELVVFTAPPAGTPVSVLLNSSMPAGAPGTSAWTFRTLPVIADGAHAMTTDGTDAILFHQVDDVVGGAAAAGGQNLFEFVASTPPMIAQIDPDSAGNRQSDFIDGQFSAAVAGGMVHLLYCNGALMHATHPIATPTSTTFLAASGSTIAAGYAGYYNCARVAPDGTLHALAYVDAPIGMDPLPGVSEDSQRNLVHLTFDGTAWTQEPVDGDGTTSGSLVADMGATPSIVFEPDGSAHAFYQQRIPAATTTPATRRLRHAERRAAGWTCETLDGAGGTPPAGAGTGPIRANVGTNASAVFFDGAIWVIYEDFTNSNLRFAHGRRGTDGVLKWDFGLLDGNLRRGSTGDIVQAAAAVVCDNVLSVFYADRPANVIRRAFRAPGATSWRFELLDGLGGPDGRVTTALAPIVTAVAAGRNPDGTPTRPLFVAYCMRLPGGSSATLRLATQM